MMTQVGIQTNLFNLAIKPQRIIRKTTLACLNKLDMLTAQLINGNVNI